jgi:hypothetical protein
MIDRKGLAARAKRLEELEAGLHKEGLLWERMLWTGGVTPIPTTDVHLYLAAIRRAITAVSEAQAVLARACHRRDK